MDDTEAFLAVIPFLNTLWYEVLLVHNLPVFLLEAIKALHLSNSKEQDQLGHYLFKHFNMKRAMKLNADSCNITCVTNMVW